MRSISLFTLLLFSAYLSRGQSLTGRVLNMEKEPIVGAALKWLNTKSGTVTDDKGAFVLTLSPNTDKLIISHVGYRADTLSVLRAGYLEIILESIAAGEEVLIQRARDGVIISDLSAIKVEQITQTELKKAACCDLAGCFETQTTVQPQVTNVLTNSKELRILGLSGVYNQILLDGFPMIQGLTYTYGISSVPGTLVDNIYVAKGANSVLQGFESICGQINVETKDPDKTDKLMLNAYMNSFMERHFNANFVIKKKKWSSLYALHIIRPADKTDRDKDNFMDLPLLTRYLFTNRWQLGDENASGWHSKIGLRFLNENRIGGQINFNPATDGGSVQIYGQDVRISQPELWSKTGYTWDENNKIVLFASAFRQDQRSWFGSTRYWAAQHNAYCNLQWEHNYQNHELKTGLSYRLLDLKEDITFTDNFLPRTYAGNYRRVEHIPGVFAENTMHFLDDKLTWIAGLRADHHNQFGARVTPRTLLKYDLQQGTIIRGNMGTGWRMVNLFSENIGLLVSSRDIIVAEALQPEQALNMGINLTHKFETKDEVASGYISVDYYHTRFQNQIFPDYDSDPQKAIVQNFRGKSISNGFQAEVFVRLNETIELKGGYNFLDVYRVVNSRKMLLPFNPRHKVLGTFSYKPKGNPYHFDINAHWYGMQRLPDTKSNPSEFQRPDFSEPFTVVSAQFTYNFSRLEIYGGCENIFDFRQLRPILSWQDPFSPYFDTSSVWGPTRGRELYLGARFYIR